MDIYKTRKTFIGHHLVTLYIIFISPLMQICQMVLILSSDIGHPPHIYCYISNRKIINTYKYFSLDALEWSKKDLEQEVLRKFQVWKFMHKVL